MDEVPPLLVARLLDLAEVADVVETALAGRVALIPLEEAPAHGGKHVVVVHAPGLSEPIVLTAEPAGEETAGLFPMRVEPLDEKQAERLRAFAEARKRTSSIPPSGRTVIDARADPLLGIELGGGKYSIERLLGSGAYGKVYGGRHNALKKQIAIKVLQGLFERDPEFAGRFHREALAASKLDHVNVLQVLDFGEEPDGLLYIVMELLDGRDLRDLLREQEVLPLPQIIEIGSQLCAALSAAHERGVVHRDVKPENVMIVRRRDDDGATIDVVKVCDFGIATTMEVRPLATPRASDGPRGSTGMSVAPSRSTSGDRGNICGTPEYMSPEQARGENVDARSDIYACGVLLYEMAVGQVPFTGPDAIPILVAHATEAPPRPSTVNTAVDRRLEAIILKALAKSPADRQQSARELRTELRALALVEHGGAPGAAVSAREGAPLRPFPIDEPAAAVVIDANASLDIDPKLAGARASPHSDPRAAPRPLSDPEVGFSELLVAVTAAVARTTYYERAHPEFNRSLAKLASSMDAPLRGRGEITLARRDAANTGELAVLSGAGEVMDLTKAVPTGTGAACTARLADVFQRRNLVSLTFKEGVAEKELGDAVELLAGPEVSSRELRAQFLERGLLHVSILFMDDMLGRERRLPWQVVLCMSRIARDLCAIPPMLRGADSERRRALRSGVIGDVLRSLRTPEQVKLLLMNWDLITAQVGDAAEVGGAAVLPALVGALAHPMLLRVASLILGAMEEEALSSSSAANPTSGSGATVRQLMHAVGNRFIGERTIESDEVLRELHTCAVLSFPELPEDVQVWVLAEQQAEALARDPEQILRSLDSTYDVPRYARELGTLSRAMRVLARRGEVASLWSIVVRLGQRHARGAEPGEDSREALAARALKSIEDAELLTPVATVLLTSSGALRDPAQGILVTAGAAGAQALCNARALGGRDVQRHRFVEALREIGEPAVPALIALIDALTGPRADARDTDPSLPEDVIRALPELRTVATGTLVARFLQHRAPQVRRAAVAALSAPWGAPARQMLLGALDDADEGVRVAALTGLRRVGAVDTEMVRRVERILTGASPGGDNVCAVAAALLADVSLEARSDAVAVLCTAIQPRKSSVVALLTRSGSGAQDSSMVVETIARVLLAIGGEKGRAAVERRASKSGGALKDKLQVLLGDA